MTPRDGGDRAATGVLCVLMAVLAAGCARPQRRAPNLILLSIDTLRADHLGCYGYRKPTSARIDELAARSVLYLRALAPTPWTLPSHAAMLTGVEPLRLGILSDRSVLPARSPPVAEELLQAGYQTGALVDSAPGGFLGAERGFSRGFQSFLHAPFPPPHRYKYDMQATVRRCDEWLARIDPARPFFLFLHTKSVHTTPEDGAKQTDAPYEKPPEYVRRFLPGGRPRFSWSRADAVRGGVYLEDLNRRIIRREAPEPPLGPEQLAELVALYDAGIFYVDEQVGALLQLLQTRGLDRDTVLILTADHGEAFLDHRFVLHREVYEPLIHVPLIVHDPRRPGARRIQSVVHLEDVALTILELAGVKSRQPRDGRPLPREETPSDRLRFAFYSGGPEKGSEAWSVRDARYKLIQHRVGDGPMARELYDLARDPDERAPILADAGRERRMMAELEARRRQVGSAETATFSRETAEELRALGYLQ